MRPNNYSKFSRIALGCFFLLVLLRASPQKWKLVVFPEIPGAVELVLLSNQTQLISEREIDQKTREEFEQFDKDFNEILSTFKNVSADELDQDWIDSASDMLKGVKIEAANISKKLRNWKVETVIIMDGNCSTTADQKINHLIGKILDQDLASGLQLAKDLLNNKIGEEQLGKQMKQISVNIAKDMSQIQIRKAQIGFKYIAIKQEHASIAENGRQD